MAFLKKLQNFFLQNKFIIIALTVLIISSFAVRAWHFDDWLYFSLDQARDAKLLRESLENGPENLPLLGPRAAGTYLRLGPFYYYFQYASASTLGTLDPYVFAVPDLLLAIASIPLFYYFLRYFLTRGNSLSATALYAFSFLSIQYSRFAWNTNSLPFWTVLLALSIYKFSSSQEKKARGRWLILAALSLGMLGQLHFVAIGGFGLMGLIFLLFYRPLIQLKYWLYSTATFLLLFLPMILSEIKTGGANFEQFKYALFSKTGNGLPFIFNLAEAIKETSVTFIMFLTSFGKTNEEMFAWLGLIVILSGIFLLILKAKNKKRLRPLTAIILFWLVVFIFLYAKTDTSLKPRFFLPLSFLPFLFFGLITDKIIYHYKKIGALLVLLITTIFIAANANAVFMWYNFLESSNEKALKREIFLKQDKGVTAQQMKQASRYITEKAEEEGKNICFQAPAERIYGYPYFMSMTFPEEKIHRIKHRMDNKEDCSFFAISQVDSENIISRDYTDDFNFAKKHSFGRVAVWDLEPKEVFMQWEEIQEKKKKANSTNQEESEVNKEENANKPDSDKKPKEEEKEEKEKKEKEEKEDPPKREERLFWKGLFETK
ncbi:MAG: hypothetical protein ACOCUF_01260 [Patescibacteria group bacterium]